MPTSSKHRLVDQYGRHITYARLSVTDRCNFRCQYCMTEHMQFLQREKTLSLEEYLRIARIIVNLGVTKIRITGGEPLVRHNVLWLIERICTLPGLHELVLTTNGSQLRNYAGILFKAGVNRINISLDTLHAQRFHAITRVGNLHKVLDGIEAACSQGFQGIKINTVMMRGVNDDELVSLTQFAIDKRIDISFIEEMPLGDIKYSRASRFFSSDDGLALLRQSFDLRPSAYESGGPARYWQVANTDTRIGFISPHSHNFCGSCNRIRISCNGELYPCLGQNNVTPLMPLLRNSKFDDMPISNAIMQAVQHKPARHDFDVFEEPKVIRFMSMTGG